jgi:hypothetical protein
MRALLGYRDARLLLAGQTFSAFGDWAMIIVLAVWISADRVERARRPDVLHLRRRLAAGTAGRAAADRCAAGR